MTLSYRSKKHLRRLGIALLIIVLVAIVAWVFWMLFIDRYITYSDDGAKLDFSVSAENLSGVVAQPPVPGETIGIYYNEGDDVLKPSKEMGQLIGYYADTDMILGGLSAVSSKTKGLEEGTPIMLDVKSIFGNYYYSTKITGAEISESVSASEMDALISQLRSSGFYLIARVPAFQDRAFTLENTNCAIPEMYDDGTAGYPWPGDDSCYWLDPDSSGTQSLMIQAANELKDLGFDEVVFSKFQFPDADDIYYPDDISRSDVLTRAAESVASACADKGFVVSFETNDPDLKIPAGNTRLYLTNVEPGSAASVAEKAAVPDKLINLVFLTDTNDTRFMDYGVMRPLEIAQ